MNRRLFLHRAAASGLTLYSTCLWAADADAKLLVVMLRGLRWSESSGTPLQLAVLRATTQYRDSKTQPDRLQVGHFSQLRLGASPSA
jgi:hypothetical protein